jgi:class 3 adenylate cyclase/tetratricopeptide (TPR) repeat protein
MGSQTVTPFVEWLEQVGLGHCRSILQAHGVDFAAAARLVEADLSRLGLDPEDSQRLLRALASRALKTGASPAGVPIASMNSLAAPLSLSGARRQELTIMFCDLVGYTSLSQRLDPEELRDVRNAFVDACAETVKSYDGRVAQVPGDALVIYFGDPAHEDDAERCVRAALDIVDIVPTVSAAFSLEAHIGIATGDCIIDVARTAYGETPNLAARLQAVAKPRQVLIANATRRLLGDAFELSDLGTPPVEDFDGARIWRVHGVRPAPARFEAAHGAAPLSALVGRAAEVGQLEDNWHFAQTGAGRAVLISGDAGIGKSRLTQVLRERIADEPHTEIRCQCSQYRHNAALHPVIAQMEYAARFLREDTPQQKLDKLERILAGTDTQRSEAAPLLAELLSLPVDRYAPVDLTPQRRKEKTLEVLLEQVEVLSAVQPVLMVVEDVHWIDPTSQQLIDALVARLERLRVLLILTYRTSPEEPPYKPRWMKSPHVRTVALTQLEADESTELACSVAKGKTLPAEVLKQVVERAAGLPLFIEELTKLHLESGLLLEDAGRYSASRPIPRADIPSTLKPFLIARLDRLGHAKELAQIGACIGRVFSHELLAAVSQRSGKEFNEDLEQLIRSELLFSRGIPPDATYTFKHALVQDAAASSLPRKERPALHARIADVLEQQFPALVANQPEILAHHRTEAGQPEAAIRWWRKAGESAFARFALQEAVAYLQEDGLRVARGLPSSKERETLELSLRMPLHSALLQWHGWAAPDVGTNADAIVKLAEKLDRPQSLLIGLWGMWVSTLTQGRVDEAPRWAQRLLAEGTSRGEIDMEILGHRGSMFSHFYLGELRAADDHAQRAYDMYDPDRFRRWIDLVGNDVRTSVGVCRSQAKWMLGYPDDAARISDEKDAHARQLENAFDTGWALTWGAYVFDYRREPDDVKIRAEEADRLGREQKLPVLYNALVPIGLGYAKLRKGELSEAISLLSRGIEAWNARGGHLNEPYMRAALGEAKALQGDIAAGLAEIEECLKQINREGWNERVWLPEVLRLKGWMLMRDGRKTEAETELRASIDCARRQDAKSWELRSSTTLAELMAADGRRDAARDLLSRVYNWFTEGFNTHDLKAARALLDELS